MATHRTTQAPIRTGVIGFGTSGRVFHAPFISANPHFSLDLIVTANPERRMQATHLYPDAQIVATVDDLLDRAGELDLVVIGSPSGTHVDLANAALDVGLAVVVDKPFSITPEQGRALIGKAQRLGLLLTVFQNRRWDGDFLTLRSLLADGALGQVRRFESRFEWWKPTQAKSWKAKATPMEGGGVLYDLGAHLIDQALQLFGPAGVAHAELHARRSDERADDDVFLVLRHHSGVLSHLSMNMLCAQQAPRFRVLGSVGGFTKHGVDPQEPFIVAGAAPWTRSTAWRHPIGRASWGATATWTGFPPNGATTRSSTASWQTRSSTAARHQTCPSR